MRRSTVQSCYWAAITFAVLEDFGPNLGSENIKTGEGAVWGGCLELVSG